MSRALERNRGCCAKFKCMESECLDLQSLKIRKKVLSTGDCGRVLRLLIGEL